MRAPSNRGAAAWRLLAALALAAACAAPAAGAGRGRAAPRAALIIVDMQNDFVAGPPGGALPTCCTSKKTLVARVNALIALRKWGAVVFTQDWHPRGHISFASTPPGGPVFSQVTLYYDLNSTLLGTAPPPDGTKYTKVVQTLWPDHCVQGTPGAALISGMRTGGGNVINITKGTDKGIDAYSAFRENDHVKSTGLGATLRARNISSVYVVGLALDYCVAWTARDAVAEGFSSTVIAGAAAPVTKAGGAQEIAKLRNDGVRVMTQWPFSPSLID